ncbi:MAG: hypothetical protein WA238_05450 [Methylocella sp.]
MADDVTITFTADVSDLQQGMQQATSAVAATTSALRSGAAQINASFASLSQAYGSAAAKKIATVQTSNDTELAIARQNEQARYDIALNGVKEQVSLVKEQAETAQISRQQELSSLLALETQREDIERQNLQFLESTYQQGTVAYAAVQRRIEELASQSALRRQEIERNINKQIAADYKKSTDETASMLSGAITGMITGHERLADAAKKAATKIISTYIDLGVKMLVNNSGDIGRMVAQFVTGETLKTAATVQGTAARTAAETTGSAAASAGTIAAVFTSIKASAAEAFAGVTGFLSPILGPAAVGPGLATEATVLATAGGLALGAWELPSDMLVQAHRGEMVVPAGVTPWAQGVISGAANTPGVNTVHVHHATNFNVTTMDAQSFNSYAMGNRKALVRAINEGVRTGAHIGLSKLGHA